MIDVKDSSMKKIGISIVPKIADISSVNLLH